MYERFLSERIAKLRTKKKVSARDMSLSIGQNENYINHIENGKSMPSMQVFFYICEYFKITPQEFFDEETKDPVQMKEIVTDLKTLDEKKINHVHDIIKDLKR